MPRRRTLKKFPLVIVEWNDACSNGGWRLATDAIREHKPVAVVTVGWLLRRTLRSVLVAQSYQPADDRVTDTIAIPNGMVRRVRTVR